MDGLVQAEVDSPNRCPEMTSLGQCKWLVSDNDRCPMHQRALPVAAKKQEIRNYKLQRIQARVNEFSDNESIKSLREEIGLTRLLIEEIVNRCQDANELILYSSKIQSLISQAEKLVVSCHKLEQSNNLLVNKDSILQLTNVIVNIITDHVEDSDQLTLISAKITSAVTNLSNPIGE